MICTNKILPLSFRKQKRLTTAFIPNGTISIGDASFSLCPALKQVTIPASVEHIGVAAFCKSGIEVLTFEGKPSYIEASAFIGCDKLKRVIVPVGTKDFFTHFFEPNLIIEETNSNPTNVIVQTNIFGEIEVPRVSLSYNQHYFSWAQGDMVKLSELFSGPVTLYNNPSYQFRKRCLFVFMKGKTPSSVIRSKEYSIPANTTDFGRKYAEKYGTSSVRIFLFICDDGENASFFDEVRYKQLGNNSIIVTSILCHHEQK